MSVASSHLWVGFLGVWLGFLGGGRRFCSRQMMNPHAKFCVDSFDWRSSKILRHQTGTRLTIIGGSVATGREHRGAS